jgi:hypothetical protein
MPAPMIVKDTGEDNSLIDFRLCFLEELQC